jgi:hypothetical protein
MKFKRFFTRFFFFAPENKLLSDWITHGVSLILLILLNCSNSVLVRGVYIDAEEPAGQCVIFPVYYIRLFFQKERLKKQNRLSQKSEKHDKNATVLLIDQPQMNHTSAEIKVITKIISIAEEERSNEFRESELKNGMHNGEDENTLLRED